MVRFQTDIAPTIDPDRHSILSIMFHDEDYFVYQGESLTGSDLIVKSMDIAWSVLKSIYDTPHGKEVKVGDHIKFGRVCF